MATLTYDPTPADQPEFTEDEQNSLAVGEQLAQQEQQLLAGKYADAQELEKAYLELQGKLGASSNEEQVVEETGEVEEEVQEEPEEEYEQENNPYPLNDETVEVLMNQAGGEKAYDEMLTWANDNFSQQEIDMYDHVMDSGDAAAAMFAIQALKNAYRYANGQEGELLTGSSAPPDPANVFRSQAEVMQAMSDPRYETDPAYRQDVFDKLDRSNVNY
jgi:hypothetical protein